MKQLFIALTLGILIQSCSKNDTNDNGIVCTEIFASIGVTVSSTTPLTNYYTIRTTTKDTFKTEQNGALSENYYTIIDDNYSDKLKGKEEPFTFVGIINGNIVVNEPYVIGADDCHVYKVSGKDNITIE